MASTTNQHQTVRTRFAPSPTGYLHIGGGRTCLFNWLFARSMNGAFILRIEDTDQARSKQEYLDEILESLQWLGLNWDELYYQSKRFDLYRSHAERLVKEGKAYAATDGSSAILLRIPQKQIVVKDLIHGDVTFDAATIKEQVLIKSDGTPAYNFACVVDDADLGITHVIRGDDHLSNTPKQIIMYEALSMTPPHFAHIPMILAQEGGRLSKRTGATAISEFKNEGYLAQALVNYLLLLGWSPGDDREIFTPQEASALFKLADVNDTAAAFNSEKLQWLNGHYIRQASVDELCALVMPFVQKKEYATGKYFDSNRIRNLIELFRERITTLADFAERIEFFFVDDVTMDAAARDKLLERDISDILQTLVDRFTHLTSFDAPAIEEAFRAVVAAAGVKTKVVIHPLRAALTGSLTGPGLFEVIAVLGKDIVVYRLQKAMSLIVSRKEAP